MSKVKVNDVEIQIIRIEEEDYISLTDMVRNIDNGIVLIEKWLRNKNTIEFLGIWEELYNEQFDFDEYCNIMQEAGLNRFAMSVRQWVERTNAKGIIAKAGRYGGTYAYKDIAFEFASWVSPKFKLYLIKEFERLKKEYGSDGIRADSNVSDLSALAQMKSLKMLWITGSEVDLTQLAGADLRVLRLDVTRIGSLEPLKQMENLSFLQLCQGPEIDSFAPLAESSVQYLSMSLSQGAQEAYKDMDYTPLTQMPQLIWLDLTNNITFDTETCKKLLANDTALKYLKISYTSAAKDAEELDTAHLKEFTAPAP